MTTFNELAEELEVSVSDLQEFIRANMDLGEPADEIREAWAHHKMAAEEETAAGLTETRTVSPAAHGIPDHNDDEPGTGDYPAPDPDPEEGRPMYGQPGYDEAKHATRIVY